MALKKYRRQVIRVRDANDELPEVILSTGDEAGRIIQLVITGGENYGTHCRFWLQKEEGLNVYQDMEQVTASYPTWEAAINTGGLEPGVYPCMFRIGDNDGSVTETFKTTARVLQGMLIDAEESEEMQSQLSEFEQRTEDAIAANETATAAATEAAEAATTATEAIEHALDEVDVRVLTTGVLSVTNVDGVPTSYDVKQQVSDAINPKIEDADAATKAANDAATAANSAASSATDAAIAATNAESAATQATTAANSAASSAISAASDASTAATSANSAAAAATSAAEDAEEAADSIISIINADSESFNINSYRWNCLHHDNFSRQMSGWLIGQNSASGSQANTYSWVTSESYDDGLRVDDGANFQRDTTRTNNFSLRKINVSLGKVWMLEVNAPSTSAVVDFGFLVKDINNFKRMYIQYTAASNRYGVIWQDVVNGSLTTISNKNVYDKKTKVIDVCYCCGWVYYYFDDEFGYKYYTGDIGDSVYLCGFKSLSCHYDFVNVFNGTNKIIWNPNYILDSGDSSYPLLTTSANSGGYELENSLTKFSSYADKFILHAADAQISHGIRSERSVQTPLGINNLRNITISFDVYFPSTSIEDESGDIFFQLHDRDVSLSRSFVPFFLSDDNGHITLSIANTHDASSTDIIKPVTDEDIFTITHDKWYHFEIKLKERYDDNQNPLTLIFIDNNMVYMSKVGNCFNDVVPSSPQYGIYKNVWDDGVTERERYFDNLTISY